MKDENMDRTLKSPADKALLGAPREMERIDNQRARARANVVPVRYCVPYSVVELKPFTIKDSEFSETNINIGICSKRNHGQSSHEALLSFTQYFSTSHIAHAAAAYIVRILDIVPAANGI